MPYNIKPYGFAFSVRVHYRWAMVKASEQHLNLIFAALADPTRRRILEMLKEGESRITDLAKPFQMSLPAISKHLKVLERAGLLTRTREGRVHRMRADPASLRNAQEWVNCYVQFWENQFDALERFLNKHQPTEHPETP